jgi:hypothetical protein
MLLPYFKKADTTLLNLNSRFSTKLNYTDTSFLFTQSDTNQLNLTNRFATKQNTLNGTGFVKASGSNITYDNSSYLRTGLADSTYLKLTGGNVTGNTNFVPSTGRVIFGQTSPVWDELIGVRPRTKTSLGLGIYSDSTNYEGSLFRAQAENSIGSSYMLYEGRGNGGSAKFWVKGDGSSFFAKNLTIGSQTNYDVLNVHHSSENGFRMSYSTDPTIYFFQIRPSVTPENVRYVFSQTNANNFYDSIMVFNNGNIAINKLNPGYKLDVNGTLGVTGAVTLSSTLAVSGNITEGGNNVLTNLDTASLSTRIDGKVSLTGDQTIGGTKTFNNLVNITNRMTISGSVEGGNQLIGKNSSNSYVSDITLGTGLSISSNVLNVAIPTERFYFDLGIVAGAADNSASTYDYTYGSNIFIVPTSLNGYCIDSVYIRAIGCSTCPPVAGDKDYYVGVYKANAGLRVATSGATLVGSQITMNEYDLNEVNRNDTLSTGEAWWVYLNGTYTSDLAYITAGFIVKKTCN